MRKFLVCILAALLSAPLFAEPANNGPKPWPNQIVPRVFVIAEDWLGKVPPLERVNYPAFAGALYSGQRLTVALMAQGEDRNRLLKDASIDLRVEGPNGVVWEGKGLRPVAFKEIKAEGSDMSLMVLKAAKIDSLNAAELESKLAMTVLAVFATGWQVPPAAEAQTLTITCRVNQADLPVVIEPARLMVKPAAAWLAEKPLTLEATGKAFNHYQGELAPGQVLALLRMAANSGQLRNQAMMGFFTALLQRRDDLRQAFVVAYPALDTTTQFGVQVTFRLAGLEIGEWGKAVPSEWLPQLQSIQPLGDISALPHFTDPVSVDDIRGIGAKMDLCWGAWMATGNQRYLRALVGLLDGAADYPALAEWTQKRGGAKGLSAGWPAGWPIRLPAGPLDRFRNRIRW